MNPLRKIRKQAKQVEDSIVKIQTKYEMLRHMTENLTEGPPLPVVGNKKIDMEGISYFNVDVVEGEATFYPLYVSDDYAVARYFAKKGTVHGSHVHEGITEYCIIVSGKMKFVYGDREDKFGALECVVIWPDIPHGAEFLEDTWLIGVTIPGEGGWPNGSTG